MKTKKISKLMNDKEVTLDFPAGDRFSEWESPLIDVPAPRRRFWADLFQLEAG